MATTAIPLVTMLDALNRMRPIVNAHTFLPHELDVVDATHGSASPRDALHGAVLQEQRCKQLSQSRPHVLHVDNPRQAMALVSNAHVEGPEPAARWVSDVNLTDATFLGVVTLSSDSIQTNPIVGVVSCDDNNGLFVSCYDVDVHVLLMDALTDTGRFDETFAPDLGDTRTHLRNVHAKILESRLASNDYECVDKTLLISDPFAALCNARKPSPSEHAFGLLCAEHMRASGMLSSSTGRLPNDSLFACIESMINAHVRENTLADRLEGRPFVCQLALHSCANSPVRLQRVCSALPSDETPADDGPRFDHCNHGNWTVSGILILAYYCILQTTAFSPFPLENVDTNGFVSNPTVVPTAELNSWLDAVAADSYDESTNSHPWSHIVKEQVRSCKCGISSFVEQNVFTIDTPVHQPVANTTFTRLSTVLGASKVLQVGRSNPAFAIRLTDGSYGEYKVLHSVLQLFPDGLQTPVSLNTVIVGLHRNGAIVDVYTTDGDYPCMQLQSASSITRVCDKVSRKRPLHTHAEDGVDSALRQCTQSVAARVFDFEQELDSHLASLRKRLCMQDSNTASCATPPGVATSDGKQHGKSTSDCDVAAVQSTDHVMLGMWKSMMHSYDVSYVRMQRQKRLRTSRILRSAWSRQIAPSNGSSGMHYDLMVRGTITLLNRQHGTPNAPWTDLGKVPVHAYCQWINACCHGIRESESRMFSSEYASAMHSEPSALSRIMADAENQRILRDLEHAQLD